MKQVAWVVARFLRSEGTARQRRVGSWLVVSALVVLGLSLSLWSARAAMQLAYFVVFPTNKDVTLQWETIAEYDLSGFEVLCKREDELDSAYHVIGEKQAMGGPQQGATYVFPITSGLERGVSYCFALREVAIGGEPGEFFPRCGYGLGLAPTPDATLPLTDTVALRATEAALRITATSVAAANIATAAANTNATLQAIRQGLVISGTATPITATVPMTATFTLDPLSATATAQTFLAQTGQLPISATLTTQAFLVQTGQLPISATLTAQAFLNSGIPPTETPTETPTATSTAPSGDSPVFPTDTPSPDPTLAQTPSPDATLTTAGPNLPLQDVPDTVDPSQLAQVDPALAAAAQGTPMPPYVVVTFTPVTPVTPPQPTLTPWPTATPTPAALLLASLLQPTTENLTLMLLCLTFFTAGGLGILGLITSALYMRSRRDE